MSQFVDHVTDYFQTLSVRIAEHVPVTTQATPDFWAAVALILAPSATGPEVLFIRRAQRADDPWSGHVALPGGRHESGDASLRATAERETLEEVGLDLETGRFLGQLDDLAPRIRQLPALAVRPFVFALSGPRPPITQSHEVAATFWVSLSELRRAESHKTVEIDIHDERRKVPAFVADDHVIWGMTERILQGFLALAPEGE